MTLTRRVTIASEVVRPWSEADVLSLGQVAKRLHMRRADAVAWLRSLDLVSDIRDPGGAVVRSLVVWGAVLRALDPNTAAKAEPKRTFRPTAPPVR